MRRAILTCSLLGLLACQKGPGEDHAGESGTESGDGDGDSTGDGDGDSTGDGDGDGDGDGHSATGDGDGDTGVGDGQCNAASDCAVVNDCCTCDAAPVDMSPPCDLPNCDTLSCESKFNGSYVPDAACLVGTCVLAPVSCDSTENCDPPPPPCPQGTFRSAGFSCFGPCVPPSMCESLPIECDANTCGEGFVCMTTQSGAPSRCVPLPPPCNGVGSCACIGPWLDEVCNGGCGDNGGTLICEDGG